MLYRWSLTTEGKSDLRSIWHSDTWGEDFSIEELEICYNTLPNGSATHRKQAKQPVSDESVLISVLLDEIRGFIYSFGSKEQQRKHPAPESVYEEIMGIKEANQKAREAERVARLERAKTAVAINKKRFEANREKMLLENSNE